MFRRVAAVRQSVRQSVSLALSAPIAPELAVPAAPAAPAAPALAAPAAPAVPEPAAPAEPAEPAEPEPARAVDVQAEPIGANRDGFIPHPLPYDEILATFGILTVADVFVTMGVGRGDVVDVAELRDSHMAAMANAERIISIIRKPWFRQRPFRSIVSEASAELELEVINAAITLLDRSIAWHQGVIATLNDLIEKYGQVILREEFDRLRVDPRSLERDEILDSDFD